MTRVVLKEVFVSGLVNGILISGPVKVGVVETGSVARAIKLPDHPFVRANRALVEALEKLNRVRKPWEIQEDWHQLAEGTHSQRPR